MQVKRKQENSRNRNKQGLNDSQLNKSVDQQQPNLQQLQNEVNIQMNEIIADVLEDLNGQVKLSQVRALLKIMKDKFKYFKTAFILLIDKILVIEEKDKMIKGIYTLLSKFFHLLASTQDLNQNEVNTILSSFLNNLISTYFLQKCPVLVQSRAAFLIMEFATNYGFKSLKMDSELKINLQDLIIDLFSNPRSQIQIYGVIIACQLINQNNMNDQLYMQVMRLMTHSKYRDVRRTVVQNIKPPFSEITLMFLGKRLRDKDDEIRRQTFIKLSKNGIKIEDFKSLEQRMLIIKEGLTDANENVRLACIEFLKPSLNDDLSVIYKLIDCRIMFVKEYYIQLPFIIMRLIFHLNQGEDEMKVGEYIESLIQKLKLKSGISEQDHENMNIDLVYISFEEILFLRIAYEFTKMYKHDRHSDYLEKLEKININYEQYEKIFEYLTDNADRIILSEWVKFSLQLSIEEEFTRRNLVSLMFRYIGKIEYSYMDYQKLLKHERMLIRDQNDEPQKLLELIDCQEYEDIQENNQNEEQVIEIEIREFRDLNQQRDILEYCKPFSFEQLVIDSDDVCRIAVIVARKLLDARIDEFSISMLQAISDIKEPLEETEDQEVQSFKKQRDLVYKKMEEKLDQVNELIMNDDYEFSHLNDIMKKVRGCVALIEEINLKEKLSFKRALNLCLILLKQCRADVNDQNLVSICETLIGPTIQSKDKDNMLLAIECIGLLCLLDKELFSNYSKIFQTILTEDVLQDNMREKIIALRSSVDSLIIHGVDSKTARLQRIIIEDYMVIKDKTLRQITIEGICKMLFSRKLTIDADQDEMEFLLSQLIIQWFDKKFNWQNSLVRQILNIFFKSFVLFSQTRCEIMMRALMKVIYSILESKYENVKNVNRRKQQELKKGAHVKKPNKRNSYEDEDSEYNLQDDRSFVSDDSRCELNQALLDKICSQLDPVQITKVFMLLLSQDYVNSNASKEFRLKKNLNVEFLLQMAYINTQKFKKVNIVKEFLTQIVDYVNVMQCDNIIQLELLAHYIDTNNKMFVQGQPKLKKLKEVILKRINQLKQEDQDFVEIVQEEQQRTEDEYMMNLKDTQRKLELYYENEIAGTLIDLIQDDDEEYQEILQLQAEGVSRYLKSPFNAVGRKSNDSQSNGGGMNLRRRRSGLRSNRKQQPHTELTSNNKKLITIQEESDMRDGSSSEKPKLGQKLINETIMEESKIQESEQESDEEMKNDDYQEEDLSNSSLMIDTYKLISDDNFNQKQREKERQERKGLMSKLSKKMARDFKINKKKSNVSNQSSCTQYNEQRLKEEYNDRTVYKISKHKSPIAGHFGFSGNGGQNAQGGSAVNNNVSEDLDDSSAEVPTHPNNLSVRFDNIDIEKEKLNEKNQKNNKGSNKTNRSQKSNKENNKSTDDRQNMNNLSVSSIKQSNKRSEKSKNNRNSNQFNESMIQEREMVNRSYDNRANIFRPNIPAQLPNIRMTRSFMKSQSSNDVSKSEDVDSESSSDNGEESSSQPLDFMEGAITKQRKALLKQQQQFIKQQEKPKPANPKNNKTNSSANSSFSNRGGVEKRKRTDVQEFSDMEVKKGSNKRTAENNDKRGAAKENVKSHNNSRARK